MSGKPNNSGNGGINDTLLLVIAVLLLIIVAQCSARQRGGYAEPEEDLAGNARQYR